VFAASNQLVRGFLQAPDPVDRPFGKGFLGEQDAVSVFEPSTLFGWAIAQAWRSAAGFR